MSISRLLLLGVLAILTACDANPPRQNPYDPEAPSHLQAKARITGRVICEGATALAGARVVATEEEGQQSSLPPVETLDDGSFAVLEVPPGKYRLTVSLAGYAEATVRDIRLGPGERRELGAISLEVLRGVLEGTVTLADGESPAGTVVSLSPSNNPNALPVTVLAGADGRWAVANLPAADYMVRAEREAYAPAYLPAPHPVVAGAPSDEIDLRLHPASAIVRFHKDGELVRYTNTREVGVELLQFVGFLRDMRLSEDPTFADPSWDVEWRDFSVKADFTLAPVEGERVVWAQFRDSLGNESQAFLGRVVYDATAPVVSFTINEGRPFLTDPAGRATLALTGFDEHAGVSAWRYASTSETSEALSDEDFLAGAFGDQPFEPIDSVAATVTAVRTIELGPEEGPRRVLVQLRDRAGNVGTSALARLYRDSTPPALGTPAIEVLGGSPARSLDVQLRLDAVGREGEQLFVAVANAPGLDANSRFVPLANPFAHRLAEGEDAMARQVCAIFKDEAGLLTEQQCLAVTVDRSGSFRGTVRLEDPTEPADGTLVSLLRLDPSSGGYLETGMGDLTGPEGGYQLTGLAPATYRLRFSRTGYRSRDLDDLVLGEGREERLAEQTLQFARGRLEGSATLGGETNHDGVRVEILGQSAFTDSTGAFSFANLRAGTWELVARRAPAFQPATTSVVIVEAQTAGASLTLAPVPSTLRGVARLAGSAVHSGIGVLVTGVTVAGSERSASTTTDEQGAFSLTGLTAGSYRVRLTASGYREVDEAIGVVLLGAGEDKQLGTWTLEPASGAIAGTVQLSDSSNHEGVRLSLQRDGREAQTTFSDQRGQFRLDPVPVGTYSLVAARGGYTRVTLTPVIVLAEQTTTVGPLTLTPQVGNVWLEDAAGAPLGSATSQTSIRVRGSYPNAAEARICERPGAAGPEDFVPDDCPWTGLVGGETETWEPVPHDFAPSECVGATSAVCDGAKVVFVQVRDAAGIESEWFSLPVILDRQPPRGIIVIQPDAATLDGGQIANGGARFTRSSVVRVAVLAVEDRLQVLEPDEVSGIARARIYRFREDTAPLLVDLREGGTVLDGVPLASLDGEDGPRELFVIVEDFAGNTSVPSLDSVSCPDALGDQLPEACDSIFLDTTPPSSVGFSINPPTNDYSTSADWALSHAVELGIDTGGTGREEDFGVEATLSNDPTFARAIVTPLELPRSIVDWNLASGEGTRRVYLRVRDEAGNLSDVYSAEIGVDTRDPDPPLLLAVGAVTGQSAPTLSFTSVEGASRYRLQLVRREGASFVTVLDDDTLGTTSFVPSPLADGSYLWRVKAIKPSGRESPFSANDAFVVDTLPPQAPLLAALPSDPTNLATPAVTWSEIEDAASYTVQWAKTSGFTGAHFGSAESVSPAYTLPLDDDGVWYWRVRARDAAGNLSAWSAAGSFERDTAPPANPPLLAPADEAFVPSRAISLSWEPVADAAAYFVDTSQLPTLASFERVESTFTSRGVTVSADGDWYWRVLARDAAGNLSPVDSAPIRKVRVDTVAPETPALVAVATPTANNRPTLSWSAVADAAGYLLTLDGTAIPVAGTSHTPDPLDDGSHTWTVAARDAAGNRSPDAPAQSFVVDTLAPAVPTLFAIAPDPTNLASPVASWTAASDAVSYEISWERTSSADPGAVTVASTSYPLSLGSDGEWRWRARAIDAVGNASAWSAWDVFTRDTIAPAVSSVALSGGAFTASPTVSVLSTVTGADALLVSGDVSRINVGAGVPRGTWVAYSDSLSIDLTSGDGLKTVSVQFRDSAGNLTAVYLDTITLDTTAPTAQSFAALQNPTRFAQVDLSLLAHGATRMCVKGSIQGSCDHDSVPPSSWEVYSTSKSVTLAGAEGDKPLSVRFADEAGNLSGTLGTSVRYDITAPIPGAPAVLVKGWRVDPAGGADLEDLEVSYTAEVMVELRADGATRVAVSNTELDCNAADYQSLAFSGGRATLHHLLANGTGTRRVRACFADEAGNVTSAALTGEIYLDQQAPAVVGFSIADGARWTRQTTVDLTEIDTVDDFPQPGFMRLMNCDSGNLSSCLWGAWMPMADSYTGWPLDGADGLKRVYLQVRDRAGNVALAPAAATIELDSLAPTTPGAPVVMPQSREATLSWAAGVDANLSEYRIDYSQDASFASGVATVSVPSSMTTAVITGLLNRVPYHFRVRALDAAGNSSGYSPSASGALGLSPMVFDPSHGPVDEWSGSPYGGPRMHYFDGELFVYGLDEGEAGRQFAIRRCRVSEEDCRAASSWSMHSFSTIPDGSGIPGSGNPYVITGSYSFVATRKSYYVSFIHSDSEGNQIILATCDRAAPGGCFGPGAEWTHRMMTSGTMQEAEGGPRLAYNGARVYLAYVRNGESLRVPFVTSCSEAKSDCATAVWASEAPFSQQVDYYNPELSLTATDERVWMAFSDANGDIRIGVCRVGTGCDENPTAVWPQYTLSKVANPTRWPQLAFSGRYLYLAWAEAFSQKMRRCPVSTGCDLATDWEPIPAGDFVASTGGVPPFSLVAAEGVLHAAWHQRSSGEVHYGSCIDPDGRDCARRGNWDSFVVERFVSQATWPGLASYGPNLALSYHDNLRRLKVIQPLIATPTVFAAAPGVGEVRAAWSATPSVDGFQQLLGSGPGTWDSQIVVPDSLATTSAVAVGPDEEMLTTLRPFRGGQLGDDALPRRVRPFQHGTVFAGAPVSYAVATNSNRIFAAYAQGTSLYLRHCNTALDCSLPASWSAAVLIYNSLHATDPGFQLVATDEKLYLVYANSASSAMYFGRCDLATGCDQPEDFSALQLLPSGGGRAPALAVADDGRLVIAANDLNTLRVFVCDDRVDCRVLGNWTVRLQISGVFSSSGKSVAAGPNGFVVLREADPFSPPTVLKRHYCPYSSTCTQAAHWTERPVADDLWFAPAGYKLVPHSTKLAIDPVSGAQHFTTIARSASGTDYRVLTGFCTATEAECDRPENWAVLELDAFPLTAVTQAFADIAVRNGQVYVAYFSGTEMKLASCESSHLECYRRDNWRTSAILFDMGLKAPYVAGRLLSVSDSDRLAAGFATSSRFEVLFDGLSLPR